MARKTKDIEAGSKKVRVTQLPAAEAPLALARVGRLYGPMLSGMGDDQRMMAAFFSAFDDADFIWLRGRFLEQSKLVQTTEDASGTQREVVTPLRLDAFDGELQAQLDWMVESVKVNFEDFLVGAMTSSRRAAEAKEAGSSTSTSPSTGGSGDASSIPASTPA